MEYKWMMHGKKADFSRIGEQFNIDPVVARVIRNRDVVGDQAISEYLEPSVDYLYDPWLFKDMDTAIDIMMDKINLGHNIRIIADYDVDGVMSCYVLYKGLQRAGANVDYEIPNRVLDGYGLNEAMVDRAYDSGINTIITCDNGIAQFAAVSRAKELGMTVIITDHHEVSYTEEDGVRTYQLPSADCVIDPKRDDCTYPFPNICGATVAYKFVQCLFEKRGIDKGELTPLLMYVGFATVCDVMPLLDENRCLVKTALDMINKTDNEGIKALISVNLLSEKTITEYHLGYVLGPCINATGRLDSANLSMKLLLAENRTEALELASQLYNLNSERRSLTEEYTGRAFELIENSEIRNDKVIVIFLDGCHESIAGIIAGRIKEKYYKPALVFTRTSDNLYKGSGRSIKEYNMYEELAKCQKLMLKFGGHAMAAGFTIWPDNLEPLRKALNLECALTGEDMLPKIMIDVPMPIDYIHFELIEQLNRLAPFGTANPKPLFAQQKLFVRSARVLGKEGNVLRLVFESETGAQMEGVYFEVTEFLDNVKEWFGENECDQMLHGWMNKVVLDIAYYPTINEFNGMRALQLNVKYYRKSED
ncbi:MAG: single-stranded-DNA-specific exonuclease RecJ [Lachnospiraceae bacterium]|nr:single-stranded-DNA-specific exonuclease RecJ [Lachnospiraceae bacterium]